MPDWLQNTADLTSPFILRRDALNVLDDEIAAGGGGGTGTGGRTVAFSQAAGSAAIIGGSPKFIVPFAADILSLYLSVVSGPSGGPLTVEFAKNGVVYATLQVQDGDDTTATSTTGLPSVVEGDELTVASTEVGSSIAAQGITAIVNLG